MKMLCAVSAIYGNFHFWARINRQTAPVCCKKAREIVSVIHPTGKGPMVLSADDAGLLEGLCQEVITLTCGPSAWELAKGFSTVYRSEFVLLTWQILTWAKIYETLRAFLKKFRF